MGSLAWLGDDCYVSSLAWLGVTVMWAVLLAGGLLLMGSLA